MKHRSRALDNPINWSFGVGRLFGIRIRLHVLFVLGGVFVLVSGLRSAAEGATLAGLGYGAGTFALLFLIVLLHEFGHCWGARRVGGSAEEILLWPLGGLAMVSAPHTPRANLITAVAGPMVNVVICLAIAVVLMAMTGSGWAVPWNPFAFTRTGAPVTSSLQLWLVITFSVSYFILLFNLAPVFPLDGGRMLQCLLWPSKGYADATRLATGVGMIGAIGFGLLGVISGHYLLLFIAVFGYLTCWQQRQALKMGAFEAESEFGYDFSHGYTSLERDDQPRRRPSYRERRRAARAERRAELEAEQLEQHRRRVDAILEKISESGKESLTPEERRVLELETERRRSGAGDTRTP